MATVDFDHAAALRAAAELRTHATYLDALATARDGLAREAVADWAGRFREDFDRELTATQDRISTAAEALRRTAGRLSDAIDVARTEQLRLDREDEPTVPPGREPPP